MDECASVWETGYMRCTTVRERGFNRRYVAGFELVLIVSQHPLTVCNSHANLIDFTHSQIAHIRHAPVDADGWGALTLLGPVTKKIVVSPSLEVQTDYRDSS
jgi:hypothetical protein